jgi:acetoacetate decarboxylase
MTDPARVSAECPNTIRASIPTTAKRHAPEIERIWFSTAFGVSGDVMGFYTRYHHCVPTSTQTRTANYHHFRYCDDSYDCVGGWEFSSEPPRSTIIYQQHFCHGMSLVTSMRVITSARALIPCVLSIAKSRFVYPYTNWPRHV